MHTHRKLYPRVSCHSHILTGSLAVEHLSFCAIASQMHSLQCKPSRCLDIFLDTTGSLLYRTFMTCFGVGPAIRFQPGQCTCWRDHEKSCSTLLGAPRMVYKGSVGWPTLNFPPPVGPRAWQHAAAESVCLVTQV